MEIKLPKGIKVGHADDGVTGVSVILCENGAVGGCDVRGGAPGTRETDLLKNEKMMQQVNAVCLSGGSAYGLEAACGVMQYLRENNSGFKVGDKRVPIVSAAVLFDLNNEDYHYPDKAMGYAACKNATATPVFGSVGAGKGATVGKMRGPKNVSKGGIGGATVKVMGATVTAIVAVNAFGDVFDPKLGKVVAGALDKNGGFIDTSQKILDGKLIKLLLGANTTIGCIVTDAKLSKVQANKLAAIGHNGLAKTIRPVHTDYDGDTLFCLATGKKRLFNLIKGVSFMMLEVAAVEAVAKAVINAVTFCKD